jgi:hypothetical protein
MKKLNRLEKVSKIHAAIKDLKRVSTSDEVAYATVIGYLVSCATDEDLHIIFKLIDEKVLAKK